MTIYTAEFAYEFEIEGGTTWARSMAEVARNSPKLLEG